jgi:hypothetical protein
VIAVVRQTLLLVVAGALSWWLFLAAPPIPIVLSAPSAPKPPTAVVTPRLEAVEAVAVARAEPEAASEGEEAAAPAPPPPELGAPEGEEDGEAAPAASTEEEPEVLEEEVAEAEPAVSAADAPAETDAAPGPPTSETLMADAELLDDARSELAGEIRQGFATALLAAPQDQVDIARFFREELVLVPRRALDPSAERPHYFRLDVEDGARVERVDERPPLEGYRQYRDLFDYEYARLPAALRELRRSVLTRSEIYLFAALIPAREWAVVVGRRRAALDESGRAQEDVRRFVLRYERRPDAGFDVRVDEIVFRDGTRFRPPHSPRDNEEERTP